MAVVVLESFLDPVNDEEEPVLIVVPQVPCLHPTVFEGAGRLFGSIPVTAAHDGTPNGDFSPLIWPEGTVRVQVQDLNRSVWIKAPNCEGREGGECLELIGAGEVNRGREGSTFGHTITVHNVFHVWEGHHGCIKVLRDYHPAGTNALEAASVVLMSLGVDS